MAAIEGIKKVTQSPFEKVNAVSSEKVKQKQPNNIFGGGYAAVMGGIGQIGNLLNGSQKAPQASECSFSA